MAKLVTLVSFDVPLTVTIAGTAQVGQTLTASADGSVASYQWQELVGGAWTNIGGATAATYQIQQLDTGRQIRVQIAGSGNLTATSAATNSIMDSQGNQPVYETDNGSVVASGHFQYVFGTATDTTVSSGGEQNIYAGGTANGSSIGEGALQIDWGTANTTMITNGNAVRLGQRDANDGRRGHPICWRCRHRDDRQRRRLADHLHWGHGQQHDGQRRHADGQRLGGCGYHRRGWRSAGLRQRHPHDRQWRRADHLRRRLGRRHDVERRRHPGRRRHGDKHLDQRR